MCKWRDMPGIRIIAPLTLQTSACTLASAVAHESARPAERDTALDNPANNRRTLEEQPGQEWYGRFRTASI